MTDSPKLEPKSRTDRLAQFPALASLGMSEEDLAVLAGQGFLAPERRQERTIYKLRYRRDGRQVVHYVGGSEKAALVAKELKTIQSVRDDRRELDKLGRVARRMLREAKAKLEHQLLDVGFKFHGRSVRRPRRLISQVNSTFSTSNDTEV